MITRKSLGGALPSALCLAIVTMTWSPPTLAAEPSKAHSPPDATVQPLLQKTLHDLPGKETLMLTVAYPPGGSSLPHRHNAHTFVYVLEGSVVMGVKGSAPQTLIAGQTFYESPTDVHEVSRNASDTKPAKLLVVFIKTVGAAATVPDK